MINRLAKIKYQTSNVFSVRKALTSGSILEYILTKHPVVYMSTMLFTSVSGRHIKDHCSGKNGSSNDVLQGNINAHQVHAIR
jgi:hypothetical protein